MKVKSSKSQFEMQDPTKQYPGPTFPEQSQPAPGLAQKMDPKPDHGEESYKGLGHLGVQLCNWRDLWRDRWQSPALTAVGQ
jgi:hypothetical protein